MAGEIHWSGLWRLGRRRKKTPRWVGGKNREFTLFGPGVRVLLSYRRWQGMAVLGWSRSRDGGVTWNLIHRVEWPDMKKRKPAGEGSPSRHLAALDVPYEPGLLPLVEHCALLQYDDGDPRKPGKFFVETMGTAWRIMVKDPDTSTQFTAVGLTLAAALEAAALFLACDDAPWEPDVFALERNSKKKK